MGDLYSMAYDHSSLMSSHGLFTSLGGAWDNNLHRHHHHHHDLGILNADMPTLMDISSSSSPFFSSLDSDPSTGYLEDALIEFRDHSKRRRVTLYTEEEAHHHEDKANFESVVHYSKSSSWNSDCIWDLPENFNWMGSETSCFHDLSDSEHAMTGSKTKVGKTVMEGMMKTKEAAALDSSSSSSSYSMSSVNNNNSMSIFDKSSSTADDAIPCLGDEETKKNKRVITRIVYPFALVKPGGDEGVVTLNDINERILMPPTRPVKHPVGDYACRSCISPDGLGISGKAVVALTRIQTQGRGTITIIRTKG